MNLVLTPADGGPPSPILSQSNEQPAPTEGDHDAKRRAVMADLAHIAVADVPINRSGWDR